MILLFLNLVETLYYKHTPAGREEREGGDIPRIASSSPSSLSVLSLCPAPKGQWDRGAFSSPLARQTLHRVAVAELKGKSLSTDLLISVVFSSVITI